MSATDSLGRVEVLAFMVMRGSVRL